MPRIDAVVERVQRDLQRAVDEIEARNEERPKGQPTLRVANIEVKVPYGVEQTSGEGAEENSGDIDELNVVPGGTGGTLSLQLTPSGTAPKRGDQGDGGEPASPVSGLTWNDLGARLDESVVENLKDAVEAGELRPTEGRLPPGGQVPPPPGDTPEDEESGDDGDAEKTYDHPILLPENGESDGNGGNGGPGGDDGNGSSGGEGGSGGPIGGPRGPIGGPGDPIGGPGDPIGESWQRGRQLVREVKGVGPRLQERLADHDVERLGALASADSKALAESTDLSVERARQLVQRATLMTLGATADDAAVLETLEIGPDALAEESPEKLARRLAESAEGDLPVRLPADYTPDPDRLRQAIERARESK